jgi:cytochrome bd-I ubiquinol oxidase subunit X
MWYFSWILGLGFALAFGVLNAIWYEVGERDPRTPPGSGEIE